MTSQANLTLLFDEHETNRDLLPRRLERQGYQVTKAVEANKH